MASQPNSHTYSIASKYIYKGTVAPKYHGSLGYMQDYNYDQPTDITESFQHKAILDI